ncbi:hypothetical protein BCR36DRAFT_414630 [Piromyces finnis]|uniref:BTB domain-containing protein n=1 Tax=Piromyces finnis TaxID=1754191 RepID=A0A1Y1V3L6_9FUNG|nr:hypothetical protein BCR36DRAFT_414630 [Piromyces finnis]|eukprot:ORX45167.1 hypothetical protein BCR36DRAFT_414630 [Piromyces finnis]
MNSLEQRFLNIILTLKNIPQLNKYIKKIITINNSSNDENDSSIKFIKKLVQEILKIINSDPDSHLIEISLAIQSLSRLLQLKTFKFKNDTVNIELLVHSLKGEYILLKSLNVPIKSIQFYILRSLNQFNLVKLEKGLIHYKITSKLIHLITINKNWEEEIIPKKGEDLNIKIDNINENNNLYNRSDKATQVALLAMTLLLKIFKQFKDTRISIQKNKDNFLKIFLELKEIRKNGINEDFLQFINGYLDLVTYIPIWYEDIDTQIMIFDSLISSIKYCVNLIKTGQLENKEKNDTSTPNVDIDDKFNFNQITDISENAIYYLDDNDNIKDEYERQRMENQENLNNFVRNHSKQLGFILSLYRKSISLCNLILSHQKNDSYHAFDNYISSTEMITIFIDAYSDVDSKNEIIKRTLLRSSSLNNIISLLIYLQVGKQAPSPTPFDLESTTRTPEVAILIDIFFKIYGNGCKINDKYIINSIDDDDKDYINNNEIYLKNIAFPKILKLLSFYNKTILENTTLDKRLKLYRILMNLSCYYEIWKGNYKNSNGDIINNIMNTYINEEDEEFLEKKDYDWKDFYKENFVILPEIIIKYNQVYDEISERSTVLFKYLLKDKVIRKEIIECGILKEFFSINQLYRILNYDISYSSYSHYFTLLKTLASDSRIRQHSDYEIPQFLLYLFSGSIKKNNELLNNIENRQKVYTTKEFDKTLISGYKRTYDGIILPKLKSDDSIALKKRILKDISNKCLKLLNEYFKYDKVTLELLTKIKVEDFDLIQFIHPSIYRIRYKFDNNYSISIVPLILYIISDENPDYSLKAESLAFLEYLSVIPNTFFQVLSYPKAIEIITLWSFINNPNENKIKELHEKKSTEIYIPTAEDNANTIICFILGKLVCSLIHQKVFVMVNGYFRIVYSLLYSTDKDAFNDRFKHIYKNELEEPIDSEMSQNIKNNELELYDAKREKNFFKIMSIIHEKCSEQILPILKRSFFFNITNKNTKSANHIKLSNAIIYSCPPKKHYPVLINQIDIELLIKGTDEFLKSSDCVICMIIKMLFEEDFYSIEIEKDDSKRINSLYPLQNENQINDSNNIIKHNDESNESSLPIFIDYEFNYDFGIDDDINNNIFNHFTWVWIEAAYAIQYLGILKKKEWVKQRLVDKKSMYYLINGINYSKKHNKVNKNDDEYVTFVLNNYKNENTKNANKKIVAKKDCLLFYSPIFSVMLTGNFSEKNEDEISIQDINPDDFQNLINFLEFYYEIKGKKIQELKEKKKKEKIIREKNNICNNNIRGNIDNEMDISDNKFDIEELEAEIENEDIIKQFNESYVELKIKKEYTYIQATNYILGLIECADRYLIEDLKEYTKVWLLNTINSQSHDIDLLIFIYTRILSLFRYNKNFKEILDECVKNILMNFIKIIQDQKLNINSLDISSSNSSISLLRWNKILLFKSDFIHRSIKLLFQSEYHNIKGK